MKLFKEEDILEAIKKVGIISGDNVFINTEIYKFGLLENINKHKKIYEIMYNIIKKIIGKNGTISTNSYTFDTLRFEKSFNYNKPNSTCGDFSNYILNLKRCVRSNHPVFSVSSIGKNAEFICKNNSLHNYGYNSPYEKFLRLDGKILNLGMQPWISPFYHVAEFMIGVPHYYNKFTKVKYFKNKKKFNQDYSSFVRYLNYELIEDYSKLKKILKKKKIVKSYKLGDGFVYSINAKKYLKICLEILTKDQFSFINKKKYIRSL